MKNFAGFILNNLHIVAVLLTGISYPYAENFLNLMNVLALLMSIAVLLVAAVCVVDPIEAKMEPLVKRFNTKSYIIKNYLFYVPMLALTSWFGLWGTLIVTLIMGFCTMIGVAVIKNEYENLVKPK